MYNFSLLENNGESQNHTAAAEIILTFTDITKEEQVNSWKEQVTKIINRDSLNLLINNAGINTPGPMEVLSLSAVRHEFEVNVFGFLTTIHAFLPLLRQAKGRIVQIGSMTPEAAARIIEISEQVPAPIRAPVRKEAEDAMYIMTLLG